MRIVRIEVVDYDAKKEHWEDVDVQEVFRGQDAEASGMLSRYLVDLADKVTVGDGKPASVALLRYLRGESLLCPYCGGKDVGRHQHDGANACRGCGARWVDVMETTGVHLAKPSGKKKKKTKVRK